jgi:hypothetical protein
MLPVRSNLCWHDGASVKTPIARAKPSVLARSTSAPRHWLALLCTIGLLAGPSAIAKESGPKPQGSSTDVSVDHDVEALLNQIEDQINTGHTMTPEGDNALVTWRHVLESNNLNSPGARKALATFVEHSRQRVESELAAGNAVIASDLSVFADQATNLLEQSRVADELEQKPPAESTRATPSLKLPPDITAAVTNPSGAADSPAATNPTPQPPRDAVPAPAPKANTGYDTALREAPDPNSNASRTAPANSQPPATTPTPPRSDEAARSPMQPVGGGADIATGTKSSSASAIDTAAPAATNSASTSARDAPRPDQAIPPSSQPARNTAGITTGNSPTPSTEPVPAASASAKNPPASGQMQRNEAKAPPPQPARDTADTTAGSAPSSTSNASRSATADSTGSQASDVSQRDRPTQQDQQASRSPDAAPASAPNAGADTARPPVVGSNNVPPPATPQIGPAAQAPVQLANRSPDVGLRTAPTPDAVSGRDVKPETLPSDKTQTPTMTPVPRSAQAATDQTAAAAYASRGDAMVALKDISAARKYYEYAANAGSARAALALGETYDPAFLTRLGVVGLKPNPTIAADWYRKAAALGDRVAGGRLQALALETAR